MSYNFKQIVKIPNATELIDITLSKTQRKTPTQIAAGFKITRIRKFYMRKVKFMQSSVNEKLFAIVDGFPKLNDIHPFYADLMNVLYDRDHYKLALGHINKAKNIVDNIATDYVRLLKYADSLYRCKQLKRAALGRMCTLIKKLKSSLSYLEEVRKHIGRLPSIDTNQRTLILTGYPNVGKSSLINNMTNANVDVQPYAFTTQSLFIGHTDYKYSRWQVIDTPGILDHPLDQRNTIEMQAITALAHLNACILFLLDISETCGYTIEQQVSLFNNIKPLFQAKPLVIVLTKIDLCPYTELKAEAKKSIEVLAKETNAYLIQMSNQSGDGIADVRARACDILLDHRLTQKAKDPKKAEAIMSKLHIAQPKKRDNKVRDIAIPDTVTSGLKKTGPTIKELQEEYGGAGKFYIPDEEHFILENEDWRYDKWPEFFNGKNVADFYDADIVAKLDALEAEEEKMLQMNLEEAAESSSDEDGIADIDLAAAVKKVRGKINIIKHRSVLKSKQRASSKIKKLDEMANALEERGFDVNKESLATRVKNPRRIGDLEDAQEKKARQELGIESDSDDEDMVDDEDLRKDEQEKRGRKERRDSEFRSKSKSATKVLGKRKKDNTEDVNMDSDDDSVESDHADISRNVKGSLGKLNRSMTPSQRKISVQKLLRERTADRIEGSQPKRLVFKPVPDEHVRLAKKVNAVFMHKIQRSEEDREVTVKKPKHLFAGKMSNGKKQAKAAQENKWTPTAYSILDLANPTYCYDQLFVSQSSLGNWTDNQKVLLFTFLSDTQKSELESLLQGADDTKKQLIITLAFIQVLRTNFKSKKQEWKMIEKKAVKWTKSQDGYQQMQEQVKAMFG